MESVQLILLLKCLFEPYLRLKQIPKQCLNLLVKLIILLGGKQRNQVIVNLLAEFGGGLIVLILPVEDVLQQGGGVLPAVEGFLKAEGFVELVEEFVVVLGAEDLADFVAGVGVCEGQEDVVQLLRVLTTAQLKDLLQTPFLSPQGLQAFFYFPSPQFCYLSLEKFEIFLLQVGVAEQEGKEGLGIIIGLHPPFLPGVFVDGRQGRFLAVVEDLHLIAADDEVIPQFHLPCIFLLVVLKCTTQPTTHVLRGRKHSLALTFTLQPSDAFDIGQQGFDGPAVISLPSHGLLVVDLDGVVEMGDLTEQFFPGSTGGVLVAAGGVLQGCDLIAET